MIASMRRGPSCRKSFLAAAIASALAPAAHAVSLNPNGLGQALIFPYYTVRTTENVNAYNTYLTVMNTAIQAKAVRVRLREGRAAKPVLDFNLYLGPNDMWTGALVPTVDGTRLLTTDTSCTDPAFVAGSGSTSLPLQSNAYAGDGFGDSLDRTREGYVELIEMATLTGASAQAVSHNSAGVPVNCAAVQSIPTSNTAPPTGQLSGTLTLINVNSGRDFTLDATALDDLATRPFLRSPGNAFPVDFSANEIDPVSVIVSGGQVYRSLWTRPQDAVSAVLMHTSWTGEFILDNATASLTDFVATLPTRHMYVTSSTFEPPFTAPMKPEGGEGEPLRITYFNREEQGAVVLRSGSLPPPNDPGFTVYASAAVAAVRNPATHMPADTTRTTVLGSTTFGMGGNLTIGGVQNGWMDFRLISPEAANALRSLPGSTKTSVATGAATTGVHAYFGLPLIGFSVRTFRNGTLSCAGAGSCQGNYGGAFAMKYRRTITTP